VQPHLREHDAALEAVPGWLSIRSAYEFMFAGSVGGEKLAGGFEKHKDGAGWETWSSMT
jgi:hypothetical protein